MLVGTMILGLLSMVLFFIKNDELPILFVLFFYTSGLNRYNLVVSGGDRWVRVAYAKNIFNLTNELGLQALNYFFLGTAMMCVSYITFSLTRKEPKVFKDNDGLLRLFLKQNQVPIIIVFLVISSTSFYAKLAFVNSFMASGGGISMGGSYYIMLGFGIGGVITLMYLIFKNYDIKKQFIPKLIIGAILAFAASMTYSSSGRFQFLSWSITIGVIFVGNNNPLYKLRIYIIGGLIVSLAFGLAGVKRRTDTSSMSTFQKLSLAWERNKSTEDATMLDGFMMVLEVYPNHLGYHYGSEHLEILYRPIPRSIWPNKPLGGYANKLGLNDNMGGGSVGISQSIYGTFYGEGGTTGIIVLSVIYCLIVNLIMRYSLSYNSDLRHIIKGITIASLVPLLRGGDLPGIYAFIGMSFWPVFVFISRYNSFLRQQRIIQLESMQTYIPVTSPDKQNKNDFLYAD
ncbi:MAG TPA: O-antigen polymerase [Catalimonadaceae bacterium]|nr:O-antigen polymerase [Catalimonadaceae bacterium]